MHYKSIKSHLNKRHSIYGSRSTTISHAFASAIAPSESFDDARIVQALVLLGQNPETLTCIYCDKEAETWDHLVNLVRDGQLHGYGHQVGNLVPCCRHCNSKKGSKEWQEYLRELTTEDGFKDKCSKIQAYCGAYAVLVDLERMNKEYPNDWEKYCKIKQQIFSLMREADEIAIKLKC